MSAPRLYVDSADPEAAAPLLASSLVYGVTTNPTILDRAGRTAGEIPTLYETWAAAGAREIYFQAWGGAEDLLEQRARDILALGDLAVVKVPATRAGFAVGARLAREGAPVLLTAVTTPAQALAAVSVGIRYLAAYLGRMRDAGFDALTEIARMQAICAGTDTNVLAASLRTPEDAVALAEAGVPYVTAAPEILWGMLDHEATDAAAAAFEAADSVQ
ncbi:transaldolase family protein [Ruania alba]|uniref:Transaldolase n=1 Tax=Ruania alba TaxID=648782 RepID=A0A1H5DML7_9MICO|nr:transaldolase family protein [Ruania alba]SED80091.1 transaldolase [Ruania alba]